MTIASILAEKGTEVACVGCETSIADAARTLGDRRIGALVVLEDDALAGIVSERDIVLHIGRDGTAVLDAPVRTIMASPVETADPQDDIDSALGRMTDRRIRHLPVTESGRLAGIVSIGDLVKAKIAASEHEADAMRAYIQEV